MTFIPLDYYVDSYIITDKLLEDNGVKLENNMSQNDFIEAISKYISSINGSKNKTLFAYPISITSFIASSGSDFVDYENKKTHFDKPEFKKIIDNYKKIYNFSPKQAEITGTSGEEGYDVIKAGTTLFSDDGLFLNDLLESESKIKGVTGETQIINSMPTYNELEAYYNKITQDIEKTEVYDPTLDDLMMKCLTPYLEVKESYDSVFKNLQEKVKVYLNE